MTTKSKKLDSYPTTIGYENHDVRFTRNPQYSLGMRTKIFDQESSSPGPGKYAYGKMTRFGNENIPAFSLGSRVFSKLNSEGPGPKYNLQKSLHFSGQTSPAYSFGVRHTEYTNNTSLTPGPNAYKYNVNVFRTRAPAFSLAGRYSFGKHDMSPGPIYKVDDLNIFLKKGPAYSLGSRYQDFKTTSRTPGPNKYNISNWKPGNQGPAFSFGVRHSPQASPLIVACDN